MRVLELPRGGAREHGRAHGEAFRPLIHEIAAIRTGLTVTQGAFDRPERVLEAAEAHLPVLASFAPELHEELLGIAEGANIGAASVVVVNHYTDLKDLDPAGMQTPGGADECTAVFARTEAGPALAQTWDMHGSAAPYLMMMHVPPREGGPGVWVLTITGCLGMTGVNGHGVGVTINNLRSTDARLGVVWPALVRRVLREREARAGRDVVLQAPLGSGHHYLVADGEAAFGIETSGTHRKVVWDGGGRYVHTNHCFDEEVAGCTVIGPESTTRERYDALTRSLASRPVTDRADLWSRLGSHEGYPKSVCTHLSGPDRPHAMTTCGGIAMDLSRPDAWGAPGCLHRARPHVFRFEEDAT